MELGVGMNLFILLAIPTTPFTNTVSLLKQILVLYDNFGAGPVDSRMINLVGI